MGCYPGRTGAGLFVGVLTTNVRTLIFALVLGLLSACTAILVDERAEIREELDQVAAETIAQMIAANSALRGSLDEAVDHVIGQLSIIYEQYADIENLQG